MHDKISSYAKHFVLDCTSPFSVDIFFNALADTADLTNTDPAVNTVPSRGEFEKKMCFLVNQCIQNIDLIFQVSVWSTDRLHAAQIRCCLGVNADFNITSP